jgi:hypothetical protein
LRYAAATEGEYAATVDDVATAAVLRLVPLCGSEGLHALPSNPCCPSLREKEKEKERKKEREKEREREREGEPHRYY